MLVLLVNHDRQEAQGEANGARLISGDSSKPATDVTVLRVSEDTGVLEGR